MNNYRSQSKLMRVLAHPMRLRLLEEIGRQPACVCDLVALTHKRQPYISQQLGVLRQAGLVEGEKIGLQVRYRLSRPEVAQLVADIRQQCGRIGESLGRAGPGEDA